MKSLLVSYRPGRTNAAIAAYMLSAAMLGIVWSYGNVPAASAESSGPRPPMGAQNFEVGALTALEDKDIPTLKHKRLYDGRLHSSNPALALGYNIKLPDGIRIETLSRDSSQRYFVFGTFHSYAVSNLIEHNPRLEWLKNTSSVDFTVLSAERILPVTALDGVVRVKSPGVTSPRFAVEVVLRNTLHIPLKDSTLIVGISPGSFMLTNADSYYHKEIREAYNVTEERTHRFNIALRPGLENQSPQSSLEVYVSFAGYGVSPDRQDSEIVPLYGSAEHTIPAAKPDKDG